MSPGQFVNEVILPLVAIGVLVRVMCWFLFRAPRNRGLSEAAHVPPAQTVPSHQVNMLFAPTEPEPVPDRYVRVKGSLAAEQFDIPGTRSNQDSLSQCTLCGAVVVDEVLHDKFHAAAVRAAALRSNL